MIIIDKGRKSIVFDAKSNPGVDCKVDHILVKANLMVKARKSNIQSSAYDRGKMEDPNFLNGFPAQTEYRLSTQLKDWQAIEKCLEEMWYDMEKV
ncbi:hypothetical protein ElyMa_001177100 [Elysia marginata]|uniref:Uncharacterized protein n=1 Tax=Elysia marginata TaxID=1093978 RepID=A0AAV4I4L2_9GAST|nr:hypothetical protein ElyMa_001177100 [Elysia marginata]